jgi:predicted unusual protein kinase regulating ubiquinone biosynthesis (AarF/ABC1/UbiB family)
MADEIESGRIARTARLGGLVAGQGLRWYGTRAANIARGTERADRATEKRMVAVAEELVARLGEMKGAAMKIGQVISTVEPFALPDDERDRIQRKLGELRGNVEPMAYSKVRKVIEHDLGGPVKDHFSEFEEDAFAAASIGQVHRATTLDGERVAVKVQYPGIAEAVESDLRNLGLIFPLVRRLAPGLDTKALGDEIRERISEELDYELEAQNHRTMARAWRGHPFVRVPAVHSELSGRRVLVSEYVEGMAFDDVRGLDQDERDRFGEIVFRFFFATLDRAGLALGDPHPGNYLLCPDGRVCFLDFGLVRKVPPAHLDGERRLAAAIADGDADAVFRELSELGYLPEPDIFEPELLLAQTQTAGRWMFEPGFRRITPELVREVVEQGSSPRSPYFEQMRLQTLPPESLLIRRMEGLLLSVLAQLRAGADWRSIVDEYVRDTPAVTPLGEQDAAYWRARR